MTSVLYLCDQCAVSVFRFIRSYLRFAPPNSRLEEVASDAGLQEKSLSELQRLADSLNDGVEQADREHRCVGVREGGGGGGGGGRGEYLAIDSSNHQH